MSGQADPRIDRELSVREGWRLAESRARMTGAIRAIDIMPSRRRASATITLEGFRGILVWLESAERVDVSRALRSDAGGAIVAQIGRYDDAGTSARALHVWCSDSRCLDAFGAFCDLFIERLGTEPIGTTLARCHEEFRRLLADVTEAVGNRTAGLLGELLLLRDVAEQNAGAVRFWAGPRGERHDFRNGSVAVEIKATLRSELRALRVHITDIDQLEPPAGGLLYLHVVRLERVQGGPVSIARLAEEIEAALGESERIAFTDALAMLGVSRPYDAATFSILSRGTYRVEDDFPRLTVSRLLAARLDPGVVNVSYDLDVDAAREYVVPDPEAIDALIAGHHG